MVEVDFLIVGGGIMGLTIARELSARFHGSRILIVEKEKELAQHASGRNSGVLHAGFYYSADSLKARFTKEGNLKLRSYCLEHGLSMNQCGKVVVAATPQELNGIYELKHRGDVNGVELYLIDEKQLEEIEPNAKTIGYALFSPTTASIDPREVCCHIASNLPSSVTILTGCRFVGLNHGLAVTSRGQVSFKHLFNCAGLYADRVAHCFGVARNYTILPFKGLYLSYNNPWLVRRHVYPVPDLENPFLGVHFTVTVNHHLKIGPTAIPALWRENYSFGSRFEFKEFVEILFLQLRLLVNNDFNFRSLATKEIRKYFSPYFFKAASRLVRSIDKGQVGCYGVPGIRAQLLDKTTRRLVMDFLVVQGDRSTHVLNSVSPAFTCSFAFTAYIVQESQRFFDSRLRG